MAAAELVVSEQECVEQIVQVIAANTPADSTARSPGRFVLQTLVVSNDV